MATITLKVTIEDLENAQLDGFEKGFASWLRSAYTSISAPDGAIIDVSEDDREEDEDAGEEM